MHFIWHDSGLSTTAPVPFAGFNHNEYLIFRISAKKLVRACIECACEDCECCDCGCNGCNEKANAQESALTQRAKGKNKVIAGSNNASGLCAPKPYATTNCSPALSVKKLNLCFYLHWGDSPGDIIEDDDTETLFLTVCNPYSDLLFRGLRVTKLTLIPAQPLSVMQIVPDSFICFDCLYPCSCKSREFALVTRKAPPGIYRIEVEYCVDEVSVIMDASGTTSFSINVVKD
ncbi:MAG: hypothetical protein IPL27_11700 [Lewinellaceae bacterium]|nr:hypothetical protein [Lewinellaceae bacterium]